MENPNWSETLEDLVADGNTEGAISFLEKLILKLEKESQFDTVVSLQLASALTELATLYSSKGFSLKSDELRSRALLVKQLTPHSSEAATVRNGEEDRNSNGVNSSFRDGSLIDNGNPERSASIDDDLPDDDWETIADHNINGLLTTQLLPSISNLSVEDTKVDGPKRRGRGTFSYNKKKLENDGQHDYSVTEEVEDCEQPHNTGRRTGAVSAKYGTRHVLVLAGFSPRTTAIDIEKLFQDFKDRGFVIRWVTDTTALVVFRTPSTASEAHNSIRCPFTVRILDDDDTLLGSISTRELEPPRERPKTSARTAQRMIAQVMGLKLPSASSSGSKEFRNQEEARKNRIVSRQKLRDDAWGDD